MRFRAAKEAGWNEISVKIFTKEDAERNNKLTDQEKTYEEYVQEITIKDNVSGGEWDWDMLANNWDIDLLAHWGTDLPSYLETDGTIDHFRNADKDSNLNPVDVYNNSSTNTLILIYDDNDYKDAIDIIRKYITSENDSPSKVILELLKNANN